MPPAPTRRVRAAVCARVDFPARLAAARGRRSLGGLCGRVSRATWSMSIAQPSTRPQEPVPPCLSLPYTLSHVPGSFQLDTRTWARGCAPSLAYGSTMATATTRAPCRSARTDAPQRARASDPRWSMGPGAAGATPSASGWSQTAGGATATTSSLHLAPRNETPSTQRTNLLVSCFAVACLPAQANSPHNRTREAAHFGPVAEHARVAARVETVCLALDEWYQGPVCRLWNLHQQCRCAGVS